MRKLVNHALAQRYENSGMGYRSYPSAEQFRPLTAAEYTKAVQRSNTGTPTGALLIYLDTPFCERLCSQSACTQGVTSDSEMVVRHHRALLREIELQGALFERDRLIEQLQIGGNTLAYLSDEQLGELMERLETCFGFVEPERREFLIEIDPRDVDAHRLGRLVRMGFNRVSIGVLDFDAAVLAAINHLQPPVLTEALVHAARELGLRSISLDLMCGLPIQSLSGFRKTLDRVIDCKPDRVAIYSCLRPLEMSGVQREICPGQLPDRSLSQQLVQTAKEHLIAADYVHIGMDRFALPDDDLSIALARHRLGRSFQGYATHSGLDMVGLGLGSISHVDGVLSQNVHGLAKYLALLESGVLPVARGWTLSREDQLRAVVMERVLCGRDVHYGQLRARFGVDFRQHFRSALIRLAPAERDGLIERGSDVLRILPPGRDFLRALAVPFDAYAVGETSQAVATRSRDAIV